MIELKEKLKDLPEVSENLIIALPEGERRLPFCPGSSLREILDATSLRVRSACGGIGACGQCRIHLTQGEVNPPTANEWRRLGRELIEQGFRLACQVRPRADVRISLSEAAPSSNWRSLSEAEEPPAACLRRLEKKAVRPGYGVAVDLGTTQIRVSLLDLRTGRRCAGRSGLNPQASFGADVLNRLLAASESASRAAEIRGLAENAIGEALLDMSLREDLPPGKIRQLLLVGNTAMLCLLAGKNHNLLLQPDYWRRGIDCQPEETGAWRAAWGLEAGTRIEVVQPLAGFVGSDLLAGVLATGLSEGPPGSLLIDFGTNSEMALWDGHVAWVTSAAGGPAFEGCGISCGMPAEPGAVYRAEANDDASEFACSVLGGGPAKGLCGSGLVDVVAALLRAGKVKSNGRLLYPEAAKEITLDKKAAGLSLTHHDIDALQRAKAAIGAGVQCLLHQAGMRLEELRRLCVCGAFGRYLDTGKAQEIGLLPGIPAEKVLLCGNTALAGCELMLLAPDGATLLQRLRDRCRLLNLSQLPGFEDAFIENLYLQPMKIK